MVVQSAEPKGCLVQIVDDERRERLERSAVRLVEGALMRDMRSVIPARHQPDWNTGSRLLSSTDTTLQQTGVLYLLRALARIPEHDGDPARELIGELSSCVGFEAGLA